MWKEQMIKDIKKTKFNSNKLFKNPTTSEFITRNEYIDLVLDDFLKKQKDLIISLGGLNVLTNLEIKINHNVEYITFKSDKFNILNCDKVLSQVLLTYIYWKYRNPNSPVRNHVNMTYIKKILGFKYKVETIVTPITHTTNCFICGRKATLIIPSYSDDRIIFKCTNCNHTYQTGSDGSYSNDHLKNQYIKCSCELCSNIKNKIHSKGINWLNELEKICVELIENTDEYIKTPNSNYMKKAFNIYMDNQNDEQIKEIFKHNPNSLNELLDITKAISNLYGHNYETLISKLKKFNVIFDVKKKTNINIKTLIMMYLLDSRYKNYATEKKYNELKTYILNGNFMLNYEMDKCLVNESEYAIMDYDFDPRFSHFYNILNNINISKIKNYIYDDSLYMNPYFIKDSNYKDNLINQINTMTQNLSESKLELVVNILKSIEKFNNKN